MLKTRIILAICVGLPLLALLFLLPALAWQIFAGFALLVTSWELLRLARISFTKLSNQLLVLGPVAIMFIAALSLAPSIQWAIIHWSCLLWLVALLWLTKPQFASQLDGLARILKVLLSLLFVLPALLTLALLQTANPILVLVFFSLIWAADIFAYFTGKIIGGPKLAPNISPGKTIAGLVGGLTGGLLVMVCWLSLVPPQVAATVTILFATAILVLISVGGDLLASLLKRHANRKDSSQLLPGHGGMLDRMDSLLASAPFYAVCIQYLGLA